MSLMHDRLRQATCSVWIDGNIKGTAWLVSNEGHLITAGHVLCKETLLNNNNPVACKGTYDKVTVRFENDATPYMAKVITCHFQRNEIDFAILKITQPHLSGRTPLSIFLGEMTDQLTETCQLYGYGQESQGNLAPGKANFLGEENIYFSFRSQGNSIIDRGFSGAAVYSPDFEKVVAIQSEVNQYGYAKKGNMLAMPLKRIATYWDELYKFAEEVPPDHLVVYVAVVAMTTSQVPEALKTQEKIIRDYVESLRCDDIHNLYGTTPDQWQPIETNHPILQIIRDVVSRFNRTASPKIWLNFISDKFLSDDQNDRNYAIKMLSDNEGLLIVDAFSICYPKIKEKLSSSQLMNPKQNVPIITVSQLESSKIKTKVLERQIYEQLLAVPFNHYSDLEPLYEFGVAGLHELKKRLWGVLPMLDPRKRKPTPEQQEAAIKQAKSDSPGGRPSWLK